MIDIYISSFYRMDMTKETIRLIQERTTPGTYQLHIFDNDSDKETRDYLYSLLENKTIVSLHLDNRNTGCLYNKAVYHAMTETKNKYFVMTDNDVYPPKLEPDWLSQMIDIMDRHPELAMLTPYLPPILGAGPYDIKDDVIYCPAIGNPLKVVRTEAFPKYEQKLYQYGDDGHISSLIHEKGYKVAFCKHIFCWHAQQCDKWGYKNDEELARDPRKVGYNNPFIYEPVDPLTYEPPQWLKIY